MGKGENWSYRVKNNLMLLQWLVAWKDGSTWNDMQDTGSIKMSWREADGLGKKGLRKSPLGDNNKKKLWNVILLTLSGKNLIIFDNSKCWWGCIHCSWGYKFYQTIERKRQHYKTILQGWTTHPQWASSSFPRVFYLGIPIKSGNILYINPVHVHQEDIQEYS